MPSLCAQVYTVAGRGLDYIEPFAISGSMDAGISDMVAIKQAAGAKFDKGWLREVMRAFLPSGAQWRRLRSCCCCLAGVAVCTWLAFHFSFNLASSGFLYLVLVVLTAVYGGIWEATVTSVVSVACLSYFFAPPVLSFYVSDPSHWVVLGTFELTA